MQHTAQILVYSKERFWDGGEDHEILERQGPWGKDVDGPLTLLHLPAKGLPGAVASHAGRVGALAEDQQDVVRAVLVEGGGGAQVALEVGAGLDCLDAGFELPQEVAHPLVALGLPVGLVLLGSGSLGHGRFLPVVSV